MPHRRSPERSAVRLPAAGHCKPIFLRSRVPFRRDATAKGAGAGLCSGRALAVIGGAAGTALTIFSAGSCRERRCETIQRLKRGPITVGRGTTQVAVSYGGLPSYRGSVSTERPRRAAFRLRLLRYFSGR